VQNIAIGATAMQNTTTGLNNTAVGGASLISNTTGNQNTAIGRQALYLNTTASNNVAVGYQALYANTTGQQNTAVGHNAGLTQTSATHNTLIGKDAGQLTTTGGYNTFVGNDSGATVTTGTKNTILGRYNGNQGNLDIRTSNNNIVLSDGDGNPALYATGSSGTEKNRWEVGYFTGNHYPQTSSSGTTSIVDTGILWAGDTTGYTDGTLYDVYISGCPNAGGSAAYRNVIYGQIIINTGFTSGIQSDIRWYEKTNATATSNGSFTVSVVFWNGSTEATTVSRAQSNTQIRIKVTGYNASYVGYAQLVRLIKRL